MGRGVPMGAGWPEGASKGGIRRNFCDNATQSSTADEELELVLDLARNGGYAYFKSSKL